MYRLHKPYKLPNPSWLPYRLYIVRKLHPMSLRLQPMLYPSDNSCSLMSLVRTMFLDRKSYKRWTLFDPCYRYTYLLRNPYKRFDRSYHYTYQ